MRAAGFRYVFLGIENVARRRPRVPARGGEERASASTGAERQRDACGHRRPAPSRHVRRRRPDRRQPRRHARRRSTPTWRSPAARRLAVHPASDAVSGHADVARLPRTRPDRRTTASRSTTAPPPWSRTAQLTAEEIEFLRWRAERWMKLRHMPRAFARQPAVRRDPRPRDVRARLPRLHVEDLRRPRSRARRLRPVPGAARVGAPLLSEGTHRREAFGRRLARA